MLAKTGLQTPAAQQMLVLEGFAPVPDDLLLEHGGRVVEGTHRLSARRRPGGPGSGCSGWHLRRSCRGG